MSGPEEAFAALLPVGSGAWWVRSIAAEREDLVVDDTESERARFLPGGDGRVARCSIATARDVFSAIVGFDRGTIVYDAAAIVLADNEAAARKIVRERDAPLPDARLLDRIDALDARLLISEASNRRLRSCLQHAEQELGRAVVRVSLEWSDSGEFTVVSTSGSKAMEREVVAAVLREIGRRGEIRDVSGDGSSGAP